ncbi:MAG: hydrogenase formation protein HypD [Candidatus Eisenbacteria bacterium]|jgi:hydrogenase expression/formation protein HypD|nr:hydrogenase formation protein HypD [Candidatus Eisenbacteria bacterium]
MRYLAEFRQGGLVPGLVDAIARLARPIRIMEVCGGHTHAICRYGLAALLPPEVHLVHGPGCPVCIVPTATVANAVALTDRPEVVVACFGDIMRVPSPRGTLLSRARGTGRVHMVYSPLEALDLARVSPDRQVVFLAIGFETTAPSTAMVLRRAWKDAVSNFTVMSAHYLVPPALRALMRHPATRVDAFIAPGHVSAVIGLRAYDFLCADHGCPVVVSGFEPLDILHSVLMILEQFQRGEATVGNQYRRAVRYSGNETAMAAVSEVFAVADADWRGLGRIAASGLMPAPDYGAWDAAQRYPAPQSDAEDSAECRCGDVLRGIISPADCALFAAACTPENPFGPCMVSTEGTCAAYYRYRDV